MGTHSTGERERKGGWKQNKMRLPLHNAEDSEERREKKRINFYSLIEFQDMRFESHQLSSVAFLQSFAHTCVTKSSVI